MLFKGILVLYTHDIIIHVSHECARLYRIAGRFFPGKFFGQIRHLVLVVKKLL